MLKIAETFYSIQGEGYWTGKPAFFIRLAGCSVGCSWCDTNYKVQETLEPAQLVKKALDSPTRHVVVTGGEPADQDLIPLVKALQTAGFFVQLETSGVYDIVADFDWITVSPKADPGLLKQTTGDECKVVFAWPISWYPKLLEMKFDHFFIQPLELGGKTNQDAVVDYVQKHPRWRLSLQTHKILGIR